MTAVASTTFLGTVTERVQTEEFKYSFVWQFTFQLTKHEYFNFPLTSSKYFNY